ncbi:hypothetical protein AX14_012992 [Amanita brunnescens Koide BX004]|nr:hypothetical protein AX14_012992 [Amanita brunnescens Koide BX004]
MNRTESTPPQKRLAESSHSSVSIEKPRKNKRRRIESSPKPEAEPMSNRSLGLSFRSVDEAFTLLETLEKTAKSLCSPESRAAYVRDVDQVISDCTVILRRVQRIAARTEKQCNAQPEITSMGSFNRIVRFLENTEHMERHYPHVHAEQHNNSSDTNHQPIAGDRMYEREGPAGLLPLMPYPDYACRMKMGDGVLDEFAHEQPERDKCNACSRHQGYKACILDINQPDGPCLRCKFSNLHHCSVRGSWPQRRDTSHVFKTMVHKPNLAQAQSTSRVPRMQASNHMDYGNDQED